MSFLDHCDGIQVPGFQKTVSDMPSREIRKFWEPCEASIHLPLPETNIAPANGYLEY